MEWVSEPDGASRLIVGAPLRRPLPAAGAVSPRHTVTLGREVPPGQWVRLDLVWNDRVGTTTVYVDGIRRDVEDSPPAYSRFGPSRTSGGSPGSPAREETRADSLPWPVGALLTQATTLRWGEGPTAAPLWAEEGRIRPPPSAAPLSNAVLDNFVVVLDEPVEILPRLHGPDYDVRGLAGRCTLDGVRLTWEPPKARGVNQGYLVYRRDGEEDARYRKLTPERVYDLTYLDATAAAGQTYRYLVAAVYADGRGNDLESQSPPEVAVTAAGLAVASVAAEKAAYGAGQELVVTLRGTQDAQAAFTLAGVATGVAMEEVDDGVYVGRLAVPKGLTLPGAALTGTLVDPATGQTASLAGKPVALDTVPPEAPARLLATAPWAGEIELAWTASPSADLDHYLVYRVEGKAPDVSGAPVEVVRELSFVDTRVVPGLTYHYAVVAVDHAGNPSLPSAVVSQTAVGGEGPALSTIRLEPFGRPLRPGQSVTLAVTGQSGGTLTVDVGTLGTALPLAEQGRTGTYLGTYTVTQADVGPTRGLHRVVAHLADDYGRSSLAGPELAVVGRDVLDDATPPTISKASHDGFAVAGFSGKLVAGDVLTVTLEGEPHGYARFEIPGVTGSLLLSESATRPGTYAGTYTVGWGDEGEDLPVLVTLADEAGNETTAAAGRPVTFDTRVRLAVSARDTLLPADRKATTRLVAKATNANGGAVSGHELALTLSTTEEYTGVVGGGRLEDRQATKDDVDNVEVRWGGVTDNFGEVAATYTAGFAAKTALILAKNLTTGDVGVGWLHTYVASTVALEILPRAARGTPDRAILRLTAEPEKLTADGRSTSRLKAWLTDLSGAPLPGERVAFALGGANGRLRVLRAVTDEQGLAEAEYRAGTLMGTVTVAASVQRLGVTAHVSIVLMADAPAKIELVAGAQRLFAGEKTALSIRVSDIHDNPNAQVPVTFAVLQGSGQVAEQSVLTDRNGERQVAFTAGTRPGLAVVEARHTSRAPTEEELRRIQGTVFVPRLAPRQERDRVRLTQWLVKPGDQVAKGQPLVTLEGGNGTWTLTSPDKGVFVRPVKHRRDRVELGDTLGYVELEKLRE